MSLLPILKFPDPRLQLVAEPVAAFDAALAAICADLQETMYAADGVGLAATQVNIQQRIFIIDLSITRNKPMCMINPVITAMHGTLVKEEGCLSFPGIYAKVSRHAEIAVDYYDMEGQIQSIKAEGLLAVCLQHELDHLNGITFFDHLSSLKKKLIRNKLAKQRDKIL